MDPEIVLVIGLIFVVLAVPSVINAFSESRFPKAALTMFVVGGACIVWGIQKAPGEFEFQELPGLFFRVVGKFIG